MSWAERIDNKKYIFGSCISVGFAVAVGYPSFSDSWWLVFLVLCSVGNQFFMVRALSALIESRARTGDAPNKWKLFSSVILKTLFLVVGFIGLLSYAPNKVLQSLALYIFQLIIFALSIKNIGKFFKKGSDQ
jgi:uncharacterized membrane-anchored protein